MLDQHLNRACNRLLLIIYKKSKGIIASTSVSTKVSQTGRKQAKFQPRVVEVTPVICLDRFILHLHDEQALALPDGTGHRIQQITVKITGH